MQFADLALLVLLPVAEGKDLLDEIFGAVGGLERLAQMLLQFRSVGQFLDAQIAIRNDDGEDVVEIMGDAAGERANRLQLLRLVQLFLHLALESLGLAALGDFMLEQLVGAGQLLRALGHPVFQFAARPLQCGFRLPADGDFLTQNGIGDGDLPDVGQAEPGQPD